MNQQLQQAVQAIEYAGQSWSRFCDQYPRQPQRLSKAECDRLRLVAEQMDRIASEAETYAALETSTRGLSHGA